MTIEDFDIYIQKKLEIESLSDIDSALNGLQVACRNPKLTRAAFAVDASFESFRRAYEWDANLLFVHHGLLWKTNRSITGNFYERLKFLFERDLALYAVHLPLDIHPVLGNNIILAHKLELENIHPFGDHHGIKLGYCGYAPRQNSLDDIVHCICGGKENSLGILPFGPEKITSIGIVSGSSSNTILQAIELGLDLFITGDASHTLYHESLEGKMHVLFAGHYLTEIGGVKELSKQLATETDLETTFIDVPTGL